MSDPKRRRADRKPQLGRIRLEVACNDANGHFANRAEALCFAGRGERIGLELSQGPFPRFRELPEGDIYIYRRRCPVHTSKEWFGNWCWNAYVIDVSIAAWLLTHAVTKGRFGFDMAEGNYACRISEMMERGNVTISEVMLYLGLFGADRQSP